MDAPKLNNPNPPGPWWTPDELAAHYKVSRRSIYREIERGLMPAVKVAGCKRVHEVDRIRYEENCRVVPTKPVSEELARPYVSPFTTAEDLRDAVAFGLV